MCDQIKHRSCLFICTNQKTLVHNKLISSFICVTFYSFNMYFECYPYFKERMEFGVELLLGRQRAKATELILAKDGSGVGAAIIAAIA